MKYYLSLFSPDTHVLFSNSARGLSCFSPQQKNLAEKVNKGDRIICYLTKVSRWCGLFEVLDGPFFDDTPIYDETNDPFTLRFRIKVLAWFEPEKSIPIKNDDIWNCLSFTKEHDKKSSKWTIKIRSNLSEFDSKDGHFLEKQILQQKKVQKTHVFSDAENKKLQVHKVRREDGSVPVSVPEDLDENFVETKENIRESIKIQAWVAYIGAKMGMKVWLPANDRKAVLREEPFLNEFILSKLPLNYDLVTLKTIENIDVLWLKGRAIIRAFEIEHTTAIYSGILRMADLLALQPNMDIKLHIVAPEERKDKVFEEIQRPVFSLLERRPLAKICTFLSYDSVLEISKSKHLHHLSDTVIDDYTEEAS